MDRKKDVIITGGENAYSPEVENAMSLVAAVREWAAVDVPDDGSAKRRAPSSSSRPPALP